MILWMNHAMFVAEMTISSDSFNVNIANMHIAILIATSDWIAIFHLHNNGSV